jgi:hypothetical protein
MYSLLGLAVNQSSELWGHNARKRFEDNCGLIGSHERNALRLSGGQRVYRILDEIGEANVRFDKFRNDLLRASDDGMPGEVDALFHQELGVISDEVSRSAASQAQDAVRQFADCLLACQHRLLVHADLLRQYTALVITEIRELLNSTGLFRSQMTVPWLRDSLVQISIGTCEQILAERADEVDPWNGDRMAHHDSLTWPLIVQQWEEFKAAEEIEHRWDNGIEELDLRKFVSGLSGGGPADVNWHQLRSVASELCPHYGSAVLITSTKYPQQEKIHAVADGDFWKEMENEFRKHSADENRTLEAFWYSGGNNWRLQMQSKTKVPSPGSERVFMSLARQAGKGLSGPHIDDLFLRWLDMLKQNGCGRDSHSGSGTISESRAAELRISDELVPPRCGLQFGYSPDQSGTKQPSERGGHREPAGVRAHFIEEFTSYLIEDVFRTSANFCLELRSKSVHPESAPTATAWGSDHAPTRPVPPLSKRPSLEAVANDEERRANARKNLVRALQSYIDKLDNANERDAHRETEIFCDYARENYASRAEPYLTAMPRMDPAMLFETGDLTQRRDPAGLPTIGDVFDLAKRIRVRRPDHWPDRIKFVPGETAEMKDILRAITKREYESFEWLLEEPWDNWFRRQVRECLQECVAETRKAYEAGFLPAGETPAVVEQLEVSPSADVPPASEMLGWEDIQIVFLSDERVEIAISGRVETRNYHEMGFVDRRTTKPNEQWAVLQVLARQAGILSDSARGGKEWEAIAKRIERTRTALKKLLDIEGDPIPYTQGVGYKARFKIGRSRAVDK